MNAPESEAWNSLPIAEELTITDWVTVSFNDPTPKSVPSQASSNLIVKVWVPTVAAPDTILLNTPVKAFISK